MTKDAHKIVTLFFNPFDVVIAAYESLYTKPCYVEFVSGIRESEEAAWGCTEFVEGKNPKVCIDVETPISGAVEILAHELAHVAAGDKHEDDHGPQWQECFDAIHARYTEIISNDDAAFLASLEAAS